MDPTQFDRVVRSLADGHPRRAVLKGLLAAVAGGATVRRAAAGAAPNGTACINGTECASGICADAVCCDDICNDGCEACNLPGSEGTCTPLPAGAEDCPAGFVCRGGVSGSFEACCGVNGLVAPAEQCCSGFAPGGICCATACDGPCDVCSTDISDPAYGTCVTIPGCGQCQADGDCGAGEICCAGACVAQECCGVGDAEHCPAGTACNENLVCEEAPECLSDADCDAGEICCGGVCAAIECCIEDEDPNARCDAGEVCHEGQCFFVCKGDADCARGTCCCPDGTCSSSCCEGGDDDDDDTGGVDQLPSTGVGDGAAGLSGLLGAGIAAAGTAYLAGKKLREATDPPAN